jgi:23S rRNA G2445 N2-methylase RlmL
MSTDMSSLSNLRAAIRQTIQTFATQSLRGATNNLFAVLGYKSQRTLELVPNTVDHLEATFHLSLNPKRAMIDEWESVDVVMQITDEDMQQAGQQMLGFDSHQQVDQSRIESYLFFAIRLTGETYTRTQLATITREVNKPFPMPVLVLFLYGETITISVINRRIHKKDASKDVLEKVTLIKDIAIQHPHRAHLDILADMSLATLATEQPITNFVQLQRAWESVLDSSELNKRFYREIANWYFWATHQVTFPEGGEPDEAKRNDTNIIRLITRIIFVWFVKEKGLIPSELFNEEKLKTILADMSPDASSYYTAILQNLFFATLNQEMGKREFRKKHAKGGRDPHRLITTLYRHQQAFAAGGDTQLLDLMQYIPFLNGGLFECLDYERDDGQVVRIDGFSDRDDSQPHVPNKLFFGEKQPVDLHQFYGTSGRAHTVRGLIPLLNRYKFTVTENTPIEEEIALDPELLGQVFENLLAAYNPETGATARKQTGSFYTPRPVVQYMVEESLIAYLETAMATGLDQQTAGGTAPPLQERLRHLLAYNEEEPKFTQEERQRLIAAIDQAKILDPACGSGAFPIGTLQTLVFVLGKLDPGNTLWKAQQLANVQLDREHAQKIEDAEVREQALETLDNKREEMEQAFAYDALDYARKLYLIQNCIYGVDIQPIAVQIAKLRCFIALIVDQQPADDQPNRGILALPNLETRFVAANTLLGSGVQQAALRGQQVLKLEAELETVRKRHFDAKTPKTKRKYRDDDARLRQQIGKELKKDGVPGATADMLAQWNPYDQNATAGFFDPVWMFSMPPDEGFAVVLGNPPYVRQEKIKEFKEQFKAAYTCYTGMADLYVYFYERSMQLLKANGILTFISSNKYFRAGYGKKLRQYLATQATILQVIDFGDAPVFTAIAYPSIIVARKGTSPMSHQVRALDWQPGEEVATFAQVFTETSFALAQKELTADGWRLEPPTVMRLLEKLRKAGTPLGEYVGGRFYRGITTGYNEAFVIDRATRDSLIAEHPSSEEVLKPLLRGRDVKRWRVQPQDLWLVFIPWHFPLHMDESITGASLKSEAEFKKSYPAIYQHLMQFKKQLSQRNTAETGIRYEWYALQRCAATYWQEFEQPKIIYPNICKRNEFAWDETGYYANAKTFILPGTTKYLLGVLNSSVMMWLFTQLLAKLQNDFFEPRGIFMSQLPIPPATAKQRKPIEQLVERILAAKQADANADVVAWEAEIDAHVYQLYGLTAEEIKVIEGA